MKARRLWAILAVLLAVLAIPGAGSAGPKKWFKSKSSSHPVVKHHAAKHPKPHRPGKSHR